MIYLWTFITAALLLFCYLRVRDFLNPAFISGAIWLGVYILLITTQDIEKLSSPYFGVFAMAYAAFFLGVMATNPQKRKQLGRIQWIGLEMKPVFKTCLFLFAYIMVLIWGFEIVVSAGLSWTAVRELVSNSETLSSGFSGIVQNMIFVLFLTCFGMYIGNPCKKNKHCFLLSLPPLFLVMLMSPRGDWFMIMISSAVMMCLIYRPKNKKIIKYGIVGFASILAIFIISSFSKFSNAYTQWDMGEKLKFFLTSYFVAPPMVFVRWLKSGFELEHGKYIFRFIYAILNASGLDVEVVNTVQPFVDFDGYSTNVFTSLYWYMIDFGVLFACVVEFGLGILYGSFYKRTMNQKTPLFCNVLIFSMLVYPIINQFFDDVLFSRLSIWIQRLLWIYLFSKIALYRSRIQD